MREKFEIFQIVAFFLTMQTNSGKLFETVRTLVPRVNGGEKKYFCCFQSKEIIIDGKPLFVRRSGRSGSNT
jgi:hypothetical protein